MTHERRCHHGLLGALRVAGMGAAVLRATILLTPPGTCRLPPCLSVALGPRNKWFQAEAHSSIAGEGLLGPQVGSQKAGWG